MKGCPLEAAFSYSSSSFLMITSAVSINSNPDGFPVFSFSIEFIKEVSTAWAILALRRYTVFYP